MSNTLFFYYNISYFNINVQLSLNKDKIIISGCQENVNFSSNIIWTKETFSVTLESLINIIIMLGYRDSHMAGTA